MRRRERGGGAIKIGLMTALYDDRPLEWVAQYASSLGYETLEVHRVPAAVDHRGAAEAGVVVVG